MKKLAYILPIVIVVVLLIVLFVPKAKTTPKKEQTTVIRATTTPTASTTSTTTPNPTTTVEEESSIPSGWLTYENKEYGFEISYPESYQVLTDANNLYGWVNGVVLLYKGGQSYDLAIQVWDDQLDFDTNYDDTVYTPVTEVNNGRVYSLTNVNTDSEIDQIISTFAFAE